jgi:hypothetical protein
MLNLFYPVLWAVVPPLQVCIAGLLIWRKLHRDYPLFLTYTLFHASKSGILFLVHHYGNYTQYFYCYWLGSPVSLLLGLLVLHELYADTFGRYDGIRTLGTVLFRWAAVVLMVLAVVTAAAAPGTDFERVLAAILVAERSMRVVQLGLLAFLFLLVTSFGLRLSHYAMGIGLGMALFTSVELVAVATRAHAGPVAQAIFSLVRAGGYSCATVIWFYYSVVPERSQRTAVVWPHPELEQWNIELQELLRR